MTEAKGESFFHVVINDVIQSRERVEKENTPSHRRDIVKAALSAIEGILWQLKRRIFDRVGSTYKLTHHEIAALLEETYSVTEKGDVRIQPKYIPTVQSIRFVAGIVQRYRPQYKLNFDHIGWSKLQNAVEIRNRLVHPKSLEDLEVSDREMNDSIGAFAWFLAFALEVQHETNEGYAERMRRLDQKLKLGPLISESSVANVGGKSGGE